MTTHQYVDRHTAAAVDERLFGDRIVGFLYSTVRENSPALFRALTSRRVSSLLGFPTRHNTTGATPPLPFPEPDRSNGETRSKVYETKPISHNSLPVNALQHEQAAVHEAAVEGNPAPRGQPPFSPFDTPSTLKRDAAEQPPVTRVPGSVRWLNRCL